MLRRREGASLNQHRQRTGVQLGKKVLTEEKHPEPISLRNSCARHLPERRHQGGVRQRVVPHSNQLLKEEAGKNQRFKSTHPSGRTPGWTKSQSNISTACIQGGLRRESTITSETSGRSDHLGGGDLPDVSIEQEVSLLLTRLEETTLLFIEKRNDKWDEAIPSSTM